MRSYGNRQRTVNTVFTNIEDHSAGSLKTGPVSIGDSLIKLSIKLCLGLCYILLLSGTLRADVPITLYRSFAGNINVRGTGGTLRTQPNSGDPCAVTNSGSMVLSGVPGGSTIVAAYLYWGGSGTTIDANVTFQGTGVTADRTFSLSYVVGTGNTLSFFGGFKDVTSQVTGNGTYTFADLTVTSTDVTGATYCSSAAVLSGFALVVIYSNPSEDFRIVNAYDGFQLFRGSAVTLTPSNFTIPTSPINGSHLVITWEGDPDISATLNGYGENLTINGNALTDTYNPPNNQYNSTVNAIPSTTTYGVDVDQFSISSYLTAGEQSATAVYSSGQDLVILASQVSCVTNTPTADLGISKSHSGNLTVGTTGTYLITVTNNGPVSHSGTITVKDTLPAGLTYVSASGTGWTCGAAGQIVTCTYPTALAVSATTPPITVTVSVGSAAFPSVTNSASVTGAMFDNVASNNRSSDPAAVLAPNLSTSTKSVLDVNAGDANPGDTLRYTITVKETGNVTGYGVTVTDNMPANVTGFSVVSVPGGAVNNSTGSGTGTNGTGYLNISNITVPANGSATVVFNVVIAGSAAPGTLINNTATITPLAGTGATPSAPTVTVSSSLVPSTGNKQLYLYGAAGYQLSRTRPSGTPAYVTIAKGGVSQVWTQSPAAQANITISPTISATVPVVLTLASSAALNITIVVSLTSSGGGTVLTQTRTIALTTTPTQNTFSLPLAAALTNAATKSWVLTIQNTTTGGGTRDLRVYPVNGANYSQVQLPSLSVINVDSINYYSAAYPTGSTLTSLAVGTTVYVRSTISDPFGSFDITAAAITITDSAGTVRVSSAAMTEKYNSGAATKVYEYPYTVPSAGPTGYWNVRVVANEGTEGTVTDYRLGSVLVYRPQPQLVMSKTALVETNPQAVPGATILYTITTSNQGPGTANTVYVVDNLPADTKILLADMGAPGSGPVLFTDGAISSGLGYTFISLASTVDSLQFSNNGGMSYGYTPSADGSGCDPAVTNIRVALSGTCNGASGSNYPSFTLKFRVKVK